MEALKNCITGQIQIDNNSLCAIVASFETETIRKGEFFLRSGQLCRKMAFIDSGYLRMYDVAEGKENYLLDRQQRKIHHLTFQLYLPIRKFLEHSGSYGFHSECHRPQQTFSPLQAVAQMARVR